jgi:hypothetical protein
VRARAVVADISFAVAIVCAGVSAWLFLRAPGAGQTLGRGSGAAWTF